MSAVITLAIPIVLLAAMAFTIRLFWAIARTPEDQIEAARINYYETEKERADAMFCERERP